MTTRLARAAAATAVITLISLGTWIPVAARRSVSALTAAAVRAYPRHRPPATAFVNGTPERHTTSTEEYFQAAAPHANAADGTVTQRYRVDLGPWRAMPKNRVFSTGTLLPGPHRVA